MKYSRSVAWLALLPGLLVASCEWPELEETPAVRAFTKQPLKISQPVRLEFECRDYCSEYALRVVNVSCPDGSCAVQNKREIIALRAGVHAVFEVAVLSRSRNEQILTGTFEADATDLRLVIAIDRTPLPALSPVGYRSESAFLVGSQFRVTIGDTRCPPGSDSYECNGFVPTNGFTLSADVAAVRLSRHEDPRPGWFWYDGFAEQSGRATFEARNNAGPIPIDPPSSVEVGTPTTSSSNVSSPATPPIVRARTSRARPSPARAAYRPSPWSSSKTRQASARTSPASFACVRARTSTAERWRPRSNRIRGRSTPRTSQRRSARSCGLNVRHPRHGSSPGWGRRSVPTASARACCRAAARMPGHRRVTLRPTEARRRVLEARSSCETPSAQRAAHEIAYR